MDEKHCFLENQLNKSPDTEILDVSHEHKRKLLVQTKRTKKNRVMFGSIRL